MKDPMADNCADVKTNDIWTGAVPLTEVWRGDILECVHAGHVAVANAAGEVVDVIGSADRIIYPRSSAKMLQALPLVESGAADAAGLTDRQVALACASHKGAAIHTNAVTDWLADLGLAEADLRCGSHEPEDIPARDGLIRAGEKPCQIHNNCSGKHCGFLTLTRHLKAGPEYLELDHPVQQAVRAAFEDMTGAASPGYGIDGCSAPNFAASLGGFAAALGRFAGMAANPDSVRSHAAHRIFNAMVTHPEMVRGEDGGCTRLMRAMNGKGAVKTGADGVYAAILPEQGLGIAIKIADGAKRGADIAIAAMLQKLGALDATYPVIRPQTNCRDIHTGDLRPASALR